jgi:acetolactate synthase-1/3 small subunit
MAEAVRDPDWALIIYAHSRPGVLAKIASVFYRRGLNIRTLTVGTTHEPELSKIVVRVGGPRPALERVALSIDNLVDVLAVALCDLGTVHAQELCLVRIAVPGGAARDAVLAAAAPFHPLLVEAGADSVVLEVASAPATIERFIEVIARFDVRDVSRTGVTTLPGAASPSLRRA